MTFGFRTVDIDRFPGRLRKAGDGIAQLGEIDQRAAVLVDQASRPAIPRDTGRLASSMTVRAGTIESSVDYAAPVHWGWQRGAAIVAGRPWLVEGAEAQSSNVVDIYAGHVIKQLEGID